MGRGEGGRGEDGVRLLLLVLECRAEVKGQQVLYLCVWLLLLLLADQSLQSLHRIRWDAEIRGKLLLEAFHPYWQLKERQNVLPVRLQILQYNTLYFSGMSLPPWCVCRRTQQGPAEASSAQHAGWRPSNIQQSLKNTVHSLQHREEPLLNNKFLKIKKPFSIYFCCTCMRSSRSLAAW